ncbi:c-type cytochrome [Paucibacter oligotrophus]|uniref:C-type cytochrome n=2 Tax=Roseateles oligotrophus TaxID=1769250 RepID=A0ABT2YEX4_9BURK|nr:c-type cytochrome [Roseateles oligotrophus]MCV2368582.1 c-type cytochrome [Roseateles oligotrophus]
MSAPHAEPAKVEDSIAQRAQACTLCHGKEGRAAADGYYPRLAGKPQGYLYKQLLNFRDGRRHYGLMSDLIDPLSDAYLSELAGYFAGLSLPYPPAQKAGLPPAALAKGKQLIFNGDASRKLPACVQCHGQALTGVQPFIPGLLGLPRDYLNGQLGAWRSGQRRAVAPDCMAHIAKTLDSDEINAISHWLAGQDLPPGAKPAPHLPAPLPLDCGGLQ